MFRSDTTSKLNSIIKTETRKEKNTEIISDSMSISSVSGMDISGSSSPSPATSIPSPIQSRSACQTPSEPRSRSLSTKKTLSRNNVVRPRSSTAVPLRPKGLQSFLEQESKSPNTDNKINNTKVSTNKLSNPVDENASSSDSLKDYLKKSFSDGNIELKERKSSRKENQREKKSNKILINSSEIIFPENKKRLSSSSSVISSKHKNTSNIDVTQKSRSDENIKRHSHKHHSHKEKQIKEETINNFSFESKSHSTGSLITHKKESNFNENENKVKDHKHKSHKHNSEPRSTNATLMKSLSGDDIKLKTYHKSLGTGGSGEIRKGKYINNTKNIKMDVAIKRVSIKKNEENEFTKNVIEKNEAIKNEFTIYEKILKSQQENIKGSENLLLLIDRKDKNVKGHKDLTTIELVMEYAKCGTLADLIYDLEKELTQTESYNLTQQIFNGINCLHTKMGIIHNDLKPENILIFKNPNYSLYSYTAKIADFGSAKEEKDINGEETAYTQGYHAPELMMGCFKSKATDIYSTSIILWELETRQKCTHSRSDYLLANGIRAPLLVRISLKNAHIINACWKENPESRISAAEAHIELATDLNVISKTLKEKSKLRSAINFLIIGDFNKILKFYDDSSTINNELYPKYNYSLLDANSLSIDIVQDDENLKMQIGNADVIIYYGLSEMKKELCEKLRDETSCIAIDYDTISKNMSPKDCIRVIEYLTKSDANDSFFKKISDAIQHDVLTKMWILKSAKSLRRDISKKPLGSKEYDLVYVHKDCIFNVLDEKVIKEINKLQYSHAMSFFKSSPKPIINYLPPVSEEKLENIGRGIKK